MTDESQEIRPSHRQDDPSEPVYVREYLPEDQKLRVFHMMDAWTDPEQVLAHDLDYWIKILEAAKAEVKREIVTRPTYALIAGISHE